MQILGSSFQIAVPEQNLDGAQIGARLQQVGRPTVAQRVRGNAFADASTVRGFVACNPDSLVRDGLFGSAPGIAARKQVGLGLAPTPVFPQSLQQRGTERQIAILAAFAFYHAKDHALAIDVADLETSQLASLHDGSVDRNQQRSSKQRSGGIDQARNFLPAQHRRQSASVPRVRQELAELVTLERFDEKESQRRYPVDHGAGRQLALSQ